MRPDCLRLHLCRLLSDRPPTYPSDPQTMSLRDLLLVLQFVPPRLILLGLPCVPLLPILVASPTDLLRVPSGCTQLEASNSTKCPPTEHPPASRKDSHFLPSAEISNAIVKRPELPPPPTTTRLPLALLSLIPLSSLPRLRPVFRPRLARPLASP